MSLGSRVWFFVFVSCFYKLTNRNFFILRSILAVMTSDDAAQPTTLSYYTLLGMGRGLDNGDWFRRKDWRDVLHTRPRNCHAVGI